MNLSDFMKGWVNANDSATQVIAVQVPFIRMLGGNGNDAILLSQILYWNMPSKEGQTKLRVRRDGELWLAKAHKDWEGETGINEHTARKSIERLKKRGLIETKVMKFAGNPTVHIKIQWEKLEAMLKESAAESEGNDLTGQNQTSQVDTTKCAVGADPLTETSNKDDLTESTHSQTTTERPKKKKSSSSSAREDASLLEGEEKALDREAVDVAQWMLTTYPMLEQYGITLTSRLVNACFDRGKIDATVAVLALMQYEESGKLRDAQRYLEDATAKGWLPSRYWLENGAPAAGWKIPPEIIEHIEAVRPVEDLVALGVST